MKKLLVFFYLMVSLHAVSQTLPADRTILKKIYGKCDRSKDSFTRAFKESEEHNSYFDSIVYKIKHKESVSIKGQNLLLVIIEAPNNNHHGHTWGYLDIYFFKNTGKTLNLVSTISSEEALGDTSAYQVTDIGKNKKALIRTFQSTGNQHFEKTKEFHYLTLNEIPFLIEVTLNYSNEAFKQPASEEAECDASKFTCAYEIIKDDKEWYDIKVHKILYGFTNGCKTQFTESQEDFTFKHDGIEYKMIKSQP